MPKPSNVTPTQPINVIFSVCTCKYARSFHGKFQGEQFSVNGDRFVISEGRMSEADHYGSARRAKAWFVLDVHPDYPDGRKRATILRLAGSRGYLPDLSKRSPSMKDWHGKRPTVSMVKWWMARFIRILGPADRIVWLGNKTPKHWRERAGNRSRTRR